MSSDFWGFDGAPSPPVSNSTSLVISSITSGTSKAHSLISADKSSSVFETCSTQRPVILPDVGDIADSFWGFDGPTFSSVEPDIQSLDRTSLQSIKSTSQSNGRPSRTAEQKAKEQKPRERRSSPSDERQIPTDALTSDLNDLRL